jgi:hypothetical protein
VKRKIVVVAALGWMWAAGGAVHAEEQLDWCAPVVVRPDQRLYTSNPCEPWWPDDEIARRADVVLDGFLRPSNSALAPKPSTCWGPQTMESSGAYHQRLRAAAAGYGRSLRFVYFSRLDLVDIHTAASPGLDADWLLDAATDWRSATDFFQRDTTPPCACGCEWSDAHGSSNVGDPPGQRLRDWIAAVSTPDTYQSKVQYTTRPSTGGSLAGAPRLFFAASAVADQRDAAYRAWRIEHMRDAIEIGDYDYIDLNHKFHQYLPNWPGRWWGAELAPDVAAYLAYDDTMWSAPAANYGYAEYLAGWAAFADDLDLAGIPFSVSLTPFMWRADTAYDDPATPEANEAEVIRGVARRAHQVLLERPQQVGAAEYAAVVADIESAGVATVVPITSSCGYGSPPGRTPPALTANLTMSPDAAVTATFTATSLRVRVGGTATGPWDADFWCHCPAGTCGTPDASTTGEIGTEWFPPIGLCDAAYQMGVGTRNPRVTVRREGNTRTSSRAVTLCAPACGNGRDDDRDGLADFPADPGCADAADRDEISSALRCDDGVDNDGDGYTDFPADPQCLSAEHKESRPACGLGVELLGTIALLARRQRR